MIGYDPASGRILNHYSSADAAPAPSASFALLDAEADGLSQYVAGGAVVDRPACPITIDKTLITANGVDSFTLSNVPTGATVWCQGKGYQVNDGTFTYTTTIAGIFTVAVFLFPTKDFWETVHAS